MPPAPLTHQPPLVVKWLLVGAIDLAIRLIALGIVPKRRRASTSTAWLLLIFLWPSSVSLPTFWFMVGNGKVPALGSVAHQLVKVTRWQEEAKNGPV